jgi:hypothetical protein
MWSSPAITSLVQFAIVAVSCSKRAVVRWGSALAAAEQNHASGHVSIPVGGALIEGGDLLVFGESRFEQRVGECPRICVGMSESESHVCEHPQQDRV